MVSITDFQFLKSKHTSGGITSLGGMFDIANPIDTKGSNNIFATALTAEMVTGSTKYRIIYVRYVGNDTPLKNCSFAKFFGTKSADTLTHWAFDPQPHAYKFAPWKDFNGTTDFTEEPHSAALNLNNFTVCCWINTTTNFAADASIVCKGIFGSDAVGNNFNFVIFMNSSEQIAAGFEESGGTDHYATSPLSYNDGDWHFICVTYDGTTIKLYIDGNTTPVATHATGTTPANNTHPLRVGSSSAGGNFWTGSIDEVRVFNDDITSAEMAQLYAGTIAQAGKIVYEEKYGNDDGSRIAQKLTNETTAPAGPVPVWFSTNNQVIDPPNVGELTKGEVIPIILRYIIQPSDPELSIEDDLTSFRFYYGIQSGQTPNPDDEGGGQTPDDNANYKIVYNADWDGNSKSADMVTLAKELGANLVLSGGDNSYSSSESKFFQVIKPVDDNQGSTIRFETGIGNHDDEDGKLEETLQHFHYASGYFRVDVENIAIIVIDSENSPTGGTQVNWITGAIKSAFEKDSIDWIIVVFHRPIYTADGKHDPDESNLRTTYSPIFEQYRVDLVLSGHQHNIQRTFPLQNKSDNDPRIMSTSLGPYDNKNNWKGPIYCIDGTGGHDSGGALYDLDNSPAYNAYQSKSYSGHLVIATSNNGKTLTCSFVDETKAVRHSWVMTR